MGFSCAFALLAGCGGEVGDALPPAPADAWPTAPGGPGSNPSTTLPGAAGAAAPGLTPSGMSPSTAASACPADGTATPGRAPIRRLTRFEYNNTVRELLGDTTSPAIAFPSEELGNGFGNDADAQSVSSLLAEQLGTVAEGVAARATEPAALARLAPCTTGLAPEREEACARTILSELLPRAYRRPVSPDEVDELIALYGVVRAEEPFPSALAATLEAVLQSPDFLYRVEHGVADPQRPGVLRPSGPEMATRLAYLFWGSPPDAELDAAAASGELASAEGVKRQAERLLSDPRARPVLRFFFDNLLPIASLSQLERDATAYPTYNAAVGGLMREEVQRLLEYEIFEGSGSWSGALTAPHTFVNEALAQYYGLPGVTGADFRRVPLDTTQRLGVLTLGGVMAGSTPSNHTNPVLRGSFVVQKLMCRPIPLPTDPDILAQIKPPDPYSGKTARERYAAHSQDAVCASCHRHMDPVGLTFENFDAVGLFRSEENGVTIDASGGIPGSMVQVTDAVGLVRELAAAEDTPNCFAAQWLDYAYGRSLDRSEPADACTLERVQRAFRESGQDVQQLLLALTQTDAFLYLSKPDASTP